MEDVKMILEAISKVADGTGNLVTYWIIAHYGTQAVSAICTMAAVMTAIFVGARCFRNISSSDICCREIAHSLGVSGFDTWHGPDRARLMNAIERLKSDAKR